MKAFSDIEPGEWFIQRTVMGWVSLWKRLVQTHSTDQAVSSTETSLQQPLLVTASLTHSLLLFSCRSSSFILLIFLISTAATAVSYWRGNPLVNNKQPVFVETAILCVCVCVSRLSVFHVSLCVSVHVFVCIWNFRHLIFVSVCAPLSQPCWLTM